MGSSSSTDTASDRPAGSVFLCVVVGALVMTQRLAIPLGGSSQLPVGIPLVLALAAIGLSRGHLAASRARGLLLGLTLCVVALLTAISAALAQHPSLLSLLLLTLIYLPTATVATDREAVLRALRFFVDLMVVAATVGLATFASQFAGVAYADRLGAVVPSSLLLTGFNTADPISYGSTIYRSNGIVFLEPSFFSFFLGLAVVVAIVLGHRTRLLFLLLGAMVCTEAGNGIVVLAVSAAVWLVAGPGRRRLLALVPPLLVAGVFAALSPLGDLFVKRSSEVGSSNTSASLRLVQPYQDIVPVFARSTLDALVGHGAGSAQRYTELTHPGLALTVPIVPKLLYEYGVVGTVVVGVFLVFLVCVDGHRLPWFAGLAVAFFLVNASLLQVTLVATSWLFLSAFAAPLRPVGSEASTVLRDDTVGHGRGDAQRAGP